MLVDQLAHPLGGSGLAIQPADGLGHGAQHFRCLGNIQLLQPRNGQPNAFVAAHGIGGLEPMVDHAFDLLGVFVGQLGPRLDGCSRLTLGQRDLALDDERTRMIGQRLLGLSDELVRLVELAGTQCRHGQLAGGLGDDEFRIEARLGRGGTRQVDDALPVVAALGDFQPLPRGGFGVLGPLQPVEAVFGAVDETGLQEVETQFVEGMGTGPIVQVRTVHQVLMHADGAVSLAAPTEQRAQGEVQFAGFGLDAHHVDEGVDGLVGLFVQEQVDATEVGVAHGRGPLVQAPFTARRHPAQTERQRNGQQPPVFELHGSGGRQAAGRTDERGVVRDVAEFLLQALDIAAQALDLAVLAHDARQQREQAHDHAQREEAQQEDHQRGVEADFLLAEHAKVHDLGVAQRKPQQGDEDDDFDQPGDEVHGQRTEVSGSGRMQRPVDAFPQLLAGFEMGNQFLGHRHGFSGLGVAPHPGMAVRQCEGAKATDLDAMPVGQGTCHGIQDGAHGVFGILGHQLRKALRQLGDQLRLGHRAGS